MTLSEPSASTLIPPQYLRQDAAPAPRTLLDILRSTAIAYPDAPAIDDGDGIITYAELLDEVLRTASWLHGQGLRPGDRIGIRMPSGQRGLYIAILSTLAAGAAYVPVDADDPQERADLVFGEAGVAAVYTADGLQHTDLQRPSPTTVPEDFAGPTLDSDAWIIFTSGSTGKPKGVAVTHRSAAAFVDAEGQLFCQNAPLGPGDRVLAGLSVAFDASCEEMWLAWRSGACLVPAPRSLVRSGADLGPWLIAQGITVVSTVPTLAGMWPDEALDAVRLLIFGGEACPQELAAKLAIESRELWNTYGPTEATVVACAAIMDGINPVSIGLPLLGWDLAVVGADNQPVAVGEVGELIIGGVGLARYLDPAKDAEKFAPMPELGWERAYRSGDHVRLEEDGLYFVGRVDDQVKIGGRRIELGEIDAALSALPGVRSASVVVQTTGGGDKVLVGYLAPEGAHNAVEDFNLDAAVNHLRDTLPAALVPRLCVLPELPVTTSGKVDKKALPWPLPSRKKANAAGAESPFGGDELMAWVASAWSDTLGMEVDDPKADFFTLGGTSLGAATLIAAIRHRAPTISVRELYDYSRLATFTDKVRTHLPAAQTSGTGGADANRAGTHPSGRAEPRQVGAGIAESTVTGAAAINTVFPTTPVGIGTRLAQGLIQIPAMTLAGARWVSLILLLSFLAGFRYLTPVWNALFGADITEHWLQRWAVPSPWWLVLTTTLVFLTPLGRLPLSALIIRALTAGLKPGVYRRGGGVHLRLWAAERVADTSGARTMSGATWITYYTRWLGGKVGPGVTLHSLPPVTGMIQLGSYCCVEPEVDLSGYWVEGGAVHIGAIRIGAGATIGTRSTLMGGANVGKNAVIEAGSCVTADRKVPRGSRWAGSPALPVGTPHSVFPDSLPPRRRHWVAVYALTSLLLDGLPLLAVLAGVIVDLVLAYWLVAPTGTADGDALLLALQAAVAVFVAAIPGTLVAITVYALGTIVVVRMLSLGLRPGVFPVRSHQGWRVWTIEKVMDAARTHLFFLYASQLTPWWFRALGATVGKNAEISTAVMIPSLVEVKEGSFLADDTLVGGYELGGGGWVHVDRAIIGRRSFLGNSGIAGPGRKVKKNSLVAVLSQAPDKSKANANWIGSPPQRLRRVVVETDSAARTYQPSWSLRLARGVVETLRLTAPIVSAMLSALTVTALLIIGHSTGIGAMFALAGMVLITMGFVAAVVTVWVKWACVGRITAGDHVLWSRFVWLNELQDQFVESVAAPWFTNHVAGTAAMNVFLRALGARIGRGAWIDSYWLPEADLCTVSAGATVGPGCVVQTHLFQDRVMSLGKVVLEESATLGPQSVILPEARIGAGTVIGPASLIMRGDQVPAGTRWRGNPVELWR